MVGTIIEKLPDEGSGKIIIPSFAEGTCFFTKLKDENSLYSDIGNSLNRTYCSIFNNASYYFSEITFTDLLIIIKDQMFKEIEHYDYVTDNMITKLGLVELGRNTDGGTKIILNDSINKYSTIVAEGLYHGQLNSNYNTTMMYFNPQLNKQYWAGMKDRNNSYDRFFTFISDTEVTLTGGDSPRGILIWGIT